MANTILYALLQTSFILAIDPCYWPNGDAAAENWVPCPGRKTCCASGEACLTNRLCYGARLNIAYRGACLDKSWPEGECPHVCHKEVANQWANLYTCSNSSNQIFTCGTSGWAPTVCEARLGTYNWDGGPGCKVSVAQLEDPISSTASLSTSTASDSATPTSSASSSATASSNRTLALGAGLGAGLGVPLVLVSMGLLMYWMRSRKKSAQVDNAGGMEDMHQVQQAQDSTTRREEQIFMTTVRELDGVGPASGELDGVGPLRRELEG